MIFRYFILLIFSFLACTNSVSETNDNREKINGFISLHPSITETIFYLEAQDKLIGRSDYCSRPKEVRLLPKFGTSLTPNLEAIAKEKPKGVLVSQSTEGDSLQQISTVHTLAWRTQEDMKSSIIDLGKLLETEQRAAELIRRFEQEFIIPEEPKTNEKVLMMMIGSDIQKGQIWYIRKDSLHGTALEVAGFQNAGPDVKTTPSMSIEELIAINPDIILLIGNDDIDEATLNQMLSILQKLTQITAVQKNQIARVKMQNIYGTGPGILTLPQKINETIESFSKN